MTLHPEPGHALTLHALTLALLVAFGVLLGTVLLHLLFHRIVHPERSPEAPVARWLHVHAALAVLGGALALVVLVFSVAHGVGALFNRRVHIAPTSAELRAGGAAPASFSLARFLPPVLDQGQTSACGAFATSEGLYTERALRHEQMGAPAWSPFFDYYYAAGGQDRGTTLDEEAQAFSAHGVVPWDIQPSAGLPTQQTIALALGQGGSYYYLFYSPAGESGLTAIKGEIARGHPVVLLIAVNQAFDNAFGVARTNNDGAFSGGYHFVLAYAYQGDQFLIRNSWGADFGQNGSVVFTQQAMLQTVLAAGVVLPGAAAWPIPIPPPPPTMLPVGPPTPRPTPRPTPTPLRPGKALAFLGPLPPYVVMVRNQYLRTAPRLDATGGPLVRRTWVLQTQGVQTPHWVKGRTLNQKATGFVLKENARAPQ